jgi:hypothetical protein
MPAPKASREDDARDLKILRLYAVDGLTAKQIAQRFRCSRGAICGIIHRIKTHDMNLSGEAAGHVAPFYERGESVPT